MQIILRKIRVTNFMNYADKEFDFSNANVIKGKNGKGKSSIANAFNWLMFNCDYQLNSNPNVRKHNVDDIDVCVEATLEIEGKTVVVKKSQHRTFGKDGSSFKDDNSYFINDVPKTLRDFNAYFGFELDELKMCSNISAFISKKSDDMRAFLFSKVETISDVEMCDRNGLDNLARLLEEFKLDEIEAMNKATIRKCNEQAPIIAGQIMEKERDCQRVVEIDELNTSKAEVTAQIAQINSEIGSSESILSEMLKEQEQILTLKFQLNDEKRKANADNDARRRELGDRLYELDNDLSSYIKKVNNCTDAIGVSEYNIYGYKARINELSDEWKTNNAMTFDESQIICPTCKRELPDDKKLELLEEFEKRKADTISRITEQGNKYKLMVEFEKGQIEKNQKLINEYNATIDKIKDEIKNIKEQLSSLPDHIEYKNETLENEIAMLESKMSESYSLEDKINEKRAKLNLLQGELNIIESRIAKADKSEDKARLNELKTSQIGNEQVKADAEKILATLDELDKIKNETISSIINSKFEGVEWRLWELAKNGNYKNCCVPTIDGLSLMDISTNKAKKILGKIAIVIGIQNMLGINAPILIDDIESLDTESYSIVKEHSKGRQIIAFRVADNENIEIEEM